MDPQPRQAMLHPFPLSAGPFLQDALGETAEDHEALRGSLWERFVDQVQAAPGLVAMIAVAVLLWIAVLILFRRSLRAETSERLGRQWLVVLAAVVAALFVLLLLPIERDTKAQIVQVLGVVLPAAVALSSTAILGNALGGLVLQRTANFQLGDFVQVGEHFGRVSERSLMNTELQTADRDLVTLPNLMLVTQPVKVVRRSGTIVSATVSLGYDVPWGQVEKALLEAARRTELGEPYVQVTELGDFSVGYRVAGLCQEVRSLLSMRSHLRTHMLDCLHDAGIEILSPNYINMRGFDQDVPSTVPEHAPGPKGKPRSAPTDVIFDKADKAQALSTRRAELGELEKILAKAKGAERDELVAKRDRLQGHIEYLERLIEEAESE